METCHVCGSTNITSFQGSKSIVICSNGHRQSKDKLKLKENGKIFSKKDDIVKCSKCGCIGYRINSTIKNYVYECKNGHTTITPFKRKL